MKTYTETEVIELMLKERQRARDIAQAFMDDYKTSEVSKEKAGSRVAWVDGQRAEVARQIARSISGVNAITATLGYGMRDLIIDKYFETK